MIAGAPRITRTPKRSTMAEDVQTKRSRWQEYLGRVRRYSADTQEVRDYNAMWRKVDRENKLHTQRLSDAEVDPTLRAYLGADYIIHRDSIVLFKT